MQGMSGDTYDDPKAGTEAGIFPYPAFELLQKGDSVFSSVFAFQYSFANNLNVTIKGEADLESGVFVSGEYFSGPKGVGLNVSYLVSRKTAYQVAVERDMGA
jgi:hypothetical protein